MNIEQSNNSRFPLLILGPPKPWAFNRVYSTWHEFPLWSRTQIQSESGQITPIFMTLLHSKCILLREVGIAAFGVHCQVRPMINIFCSGLCSILWHYEIQLAGKKFPGHSEIDFLMSFNQSMWCLQQSLWWASKNNGNSPCCFGYH